MSPSRPPSRLAWLLLGGAALLRLDVWFAGDGRLVLGLPISLAYHVVFALAMTGLMALLAGWALPKSEEGEAAPRPYGEAPRKPA